nr:YdcF family protein [Desulfobacula sp.]
MNTLFFLLSKLFWLVCSPESLLVILIFSCFFLMFIKAHQKARWLGIFLSVLIFMITVFPVGDWILYPLESRFPPVSGLSSPIDGIIVLGGSEDIAGSFAWGQAELNQHSERFFAFIKLMKAFPRARHVYSGGTGDPLRQEYKGSEVAKKLLREQGFDISTILFESESRNTYENAVFTKEKVRPGPDEHWVLITSASHMPRALGIFHKIGWKVIPFPVNHDTNPGSLFRLTWNFSGNLKKLDGAAYEWVGLLAYYLTGKTSEFFPGPS